MSDFLKTYFFLVAVVELAGRGIESDGDLLARLVTGLRDGFEYHFNGLGVRLDRWRKSAFIADCGVVAALLQYALQHMESFDAPAQSFAERLCAHRHDHELLKVHVVVGMGSAIKDVHHRRGQQTGRETAKISVEFNSQVVSHGARRRHGHGQNRIRAQLALRRRTVEHQHGIVKVALFAGIHAFKFRRNHLVDVLDGLQNALARIAALVAIAQLQRFMLAGGGAAGNRRSPACPALQNDVSFDRGITARIQNFAGQNQLNLSHGNKS